MSRVAEPSVLHIGSRRSDLARLQTLMIADLLQDEMGVKVMLNDGVFSPCHFVCKSCSARYLVPVIGAFHVGLRPSQIGPTNSLGLWSSG